MLNEHHRYEEHKQVKFEPASLKALPLLPYTVYVHTFSQRGIILKMS